jgi:hypothetical protein
MIRILALSLVGRGRSARGEDMLDIRFWREGDRTAFVVLKGDRALVERRGIAA